MNYLLTFLISMIPLIELRGAVPFGIASGIPFTQALAISVIGNMIPVPIIFFFARKVLEWGTDKPYIGNFFTWCLKKGHSGGEKLSKVAGSKGIFWALLLFVGIPLPGTGAWTGTLAASILDWDFKRSVFAVMLGVILAGIIMGSLSLIFGLNTFSH
ncbi:COG2426 family protein [Streptococcus hillyeri]|uniref:COG2426 family protein n=1 Tax=Streptococcus hillyeri TaxID=2282420 RepID=UPI0034E23AC1